MKKVVTILILTVLISCSGNTQVPFQEHLLGASAQRVTGIVSADFDLDGDVDIITCLRIENKIVAHINTGGELPSFETNVIAQNIQGPFYICSSDLNQDEYLDVVVSLIGSNKIAALINPGDLNQNWPEYIVTSNFSEPHGVAIADINGDGLNDIIGNAAAGNTIAYWKNNGGNPDTWTKKVVTSNFNYTQSVDAADFDDDGDIDLLASANQANTIALWLNDGSANPNWQKIIIDNSFSVAHDACFGDANGDGLMDIFGAACGSNQIACWINTGNNPPAFTKIVISNNFPCALTVKLGDIDNDGDIDVAGSAWGNGTVAWFKNRMNINGGWVENILTDDLNGAWPVYLADFENDNDIDILAGADILNGGGANGTFTLWQNKLYNTTAVDEKSRNGCEISYYYPGNEIWVKPNKIIKGKQTLQIFDSLGRLIFSDIIIDTNGQKMVVKLPSALDRSGLIHIIVLSNNVVTARKSLVVN